MIKDENNMNELTIIDDTMNSLQDVNNTLSEQTEDIAKQIVNETSLQGVQDLTHLFNVAQVKKQVLRNLTYNQLLDKITNQMDERLEKRADQFSNKDLLDYAKVVQDGIDKAQKQIQSIDTTPAIQVNTQNNIVIQAGDDLDRESRQRVMTAAKAAMDFLMQQSGNNNNSIIDSLNLTEEINVDMNSGYETEDSLPNDNEYCDEDISEVNEESFDLYLSSEQEQQ